MKLVIQFSIVKTATNLIWRQVHWKCILEHILYHVNVKYAASLFQDHGCYKVMLEHTQVRSHLNVRFASGHLLTAQTWELICKRIVLLKSIIAAIVIERFQGCLCCTDIMRILSVRMGHVYEIYFFCFFLFYYYFIICLLSFNLFK